MYSSISKTLILFVLVIGAFSCKKKSTTTPPSTNSENIVVDIPYTKSKTLTDAIPALPLSVPVNITDTFATLVDQYITPYGFTKNDIISVTPVMMNVVIDNNTSQTLNFADDSVKVFVDAYGGSNPLLVAYKKGIPLNAKSVDMDIENKDFKDYFNNEYMQVTLNFNTRLNEAMAANTTFITNFKFRITAKKPQ
ncbi:MAG TPA: hypothetical protein DCF44_06670 [Chitinophagaceae bacterium]|nr:hypothetical protein [Chitinophagaceae bacterium]